MNRAVVWLALLLLPLAAFAARSVNFASAGTVEDASSAVLVVPGDSDRLLVQVDNPLVATIAVTLSADPNAVGALWDDQAWPVDGSGTMSLPGGITGVRITADGDDVEYVVRGTTEL